MAAPEIAEPPAPNLSAPKSRTLLYGSLAAVVLVALVVVGLGFANVVPGFHLRPSSPPATAPAATYAVEFTQTGLPAGTSWSVALAGATLTSTGASVTFQKSAGNYPFTVSPVAGYEVAPSSGTVTVAAQAVTVELAFEVSPSPSGPAKYELTFDESGLPAGTSWAVTANNTQQTSTGTAVSFSLPNGSYTYSIGSVLGYGASPRGGSVTVSGANHAVAVQFSLAPSYSLTFNETGLPAATPWSVTVNGTELAGSADQLSLAEPNGSYDFTVGGASGYTPSPAGGSVSVQGGPAFVDITFLSAAPPPSNASFPVEFNQTGLPANGTWQLDILSQSSPILQQITEGPSQTVDVRNGTYEWEAFAEYQNASLPAGSAYIGSPSNATVVVSGVATYVSIEFVAVVPTNATYAVNFTETGLPVGAGWTVSGGTGPVSAAAGAPIVIDFANGSDFYIASTNATDYGGAGFGGIVVEGAPLSVQVTFWAVTDVVFNVTGGLPVLPWNANVTQGGTLVDYEYGDYNGNYSFEVPDGAYNWSAGALGYSLTPSSGSFTANGANVTIVMSAASVATYSVTFDVGGLPSSDQWNPSLWLWGGPGIDYGPSAVVGGAGSPTLSVSNGTYGWSVSAVTGSYIAEPASGVVVVDGGSATVYSNFSAVPTDDLIVLFAQPAFPYSNSTQAPVGDSWGVTFNGTEQSTTGDFMEFVVPNGTYSYTVEPPPGYAATPTSGELMVDAEPSATTSYAVAGVTITFSAAALLPLEGARAPAAPPPMLGTVRPE